MNIPSSKSKNCKHTDCRPISPIDFCHVARNFPNFSKFVAHQITMTIDKIIRSILSFFKTIIPDSNGNEVYKKIPEIW